MSKFEAEVRYLPDSLLEKLYEATTIAVTEAMESVLEAFELPEATLSNLAYIEHEHMLRKMSTPARQRKAMITAPGTLFDLSPKVALEETQAPPDFDSQRDEDVALWAHVDAAVTDIDEPAAQSGQSPHKEQKPRKRVSITIKKE